MSFASTLNDYCTATGRANREIAEECGIAPSVLSRYRSGSRVPEPSSPTIRDLAAGIAMLSRKAGDTAPGEKEILRALESSLTESRLIGMNFNMRLDMLMHLVGIRNAKMAEAAQVDPSYVSRIRQGSRTPANLSEFVEHASRLAARLCLDNALEAEVAELLETSDLDDLNRSADAESDLSEIIGDWLLGSEITKGDIVIMESLFAWLDEADFSYWLTMHDNLERAADREPVIEPANSARFYYGIDGMRNAEVDFLTTAAETNSRKLSLSSDMPLLQMALDPTFIANYRKGIERLLEQGCHIDIVHGVERPLSESIRVLRLWMPFYMTGLVTPYYLKGVHNRLFYHVNYVCDRCALSSEAVMGHQEDGRYYYTTRPADVAYYKKKMRFILQASSSLLGIYRDDVPEQRTAFARSEATRRIPGRAVAEGRYKNLTITSHTSECTVLTLRCEPTTVHFVICHPKINYAVTRMK